MPDIPNVNCKIVVAKELTEEEKSEAKTQAIEQYREEQLRAIRRENQPKTSNKSTSTQKEKEINVEQGNLFGDDF